MTSKHTDRLLEIHGTDPARWPPAARAQLDATDPARRAAEARLDAWLDQSCPPPMPVALRTRVLAHAAAIATSARPSRTGLWSSLWQLLGGPRVVAPTFALALLAGVMLGNGLAPLSSRLAPPADETLWLSLGQLDDSYWELVP